MSWSINGRVYHNYEEYRRALARQQNDRLRHLVEQLEIPPADTSRLESRLAATQVRREAIQRMSSEIRQQTEARRQQATAHRQSIGEASAQTQQMEDRLLADLERAGERLEGQVEALEAERRQHVAQTAEALQEELAADGRTDKRTEARQSEWLRRARSILQALDPPQLERLGLDTIAAKEQTERAAGTRGVEGLELARRALEAARELEAETARRQGRLEAQAAVFQSEIKQLQEALIFSAEDRNELVGEGATALDAPFHRELERLSERAATFNHYEDHEARYASLYQALATVGPRVLDLAAQVRDFDLLEQSRFQLIKDKLEGKLRKILGEAVELEEVIPGELGLHPVEARLRTAGGEKVDCTVAIDGSLRLHHHGHADQATCAQAARRLAEGVPELMEMTSGPQLDVATEHRSADAAQLRQPLIKERNL